MPDLLTSDTDTAAAEVADLERRLVGARRRLQTARGKRGDERKPAPSATEQQLAASLSAADGGSWIWELATDELILSDACWEMIGFTPGGLADNAEAWLTRFHPDDLPRVQACLDRVVAGPDNSYRELVRLRTRDEVYRHAVSAGRVHGRNADGRAVRVVGILLDVEATEGLRLRVEQQNALLAERVAQLDARNEELDRFTHVASHDLRSPLRSILGFASHLERALEPDSLEAGYTRRIARAGQRMTELLDALLGWAGASRRLRTPGPVDLNEVVLDVLGNLVNAPPDATVCLGPLPHVHGDAVLLRTVLQNLIGNAMKYAGDRPARIAVTAQAPGAEDEKGDGSGGEPASVWICVADAGEGFDPADAEKLFEPFQRMSHPSITGSGVGLSIVRRVVENHGGRAWADLGHGPLPTRFWLELPLQARA